MKRFLRFGCVAALAIWVGGCEWEDAGEDGTWDDSYSWINFSGLYRGVNGPLVGNFSYATVDGDDDDGSTGTVVNDEPGGVAPDGQTILTGTLVNKPGINPGSVTIVLVPGAPGDSSGTATDNGSGGLVGSFNLVGLDDSTALPMSGTINYDTGAWTLNLTSPGLLTPATILVSYTYSQSSGASTEPETDLDVAGGAVATMLVEQTGNLLRFTDSNGNLYQGKLSVVTLAGGDRTGRTSGNISATYEVNGTAGGQSIRISGSFSGAYTAPAADQAFGVLSDRLLEGIWVQPNGTADVRGVAPEMNVEVQGTTSTTTE